MKRYSLSIRRVGHPRLPSATLGDPAVGGRWHRATATGQTPGPAHQLSRQAPLPCRCRCRRSRRCNRCTGGSVRLRRPPVLAMLRSSPAMSPVTASAPPATASCPVCAATIRWWPRPPPRSAPSLAGAPASVGEVDRHLSRSASPAGHEEGRGGWREAGAEARGAQAEDRGRGGHGRRPGPDPEAEATDREEGRAYAGVS
jgi:hypothetical protein